MEKEKHMKLMLEMYSRSEEECNEMFNSGVFNDIVKGVVALALDDCNYEHDSVKKVLNQCDIVFDSFTAGQCREFYKHY